MTTKNYDTAQFSDVAKECGRQIAQVLLLVFAVIAAITGLVSNADRIERVWIRFVNIVTFGSTSLMLVYSLLAVLLITSVWSLCVAHKMRNRLKIVDSMRRTLFAMSLLTWFFALVGFQFHSSIIGETIRQSFGRCAVLTLCMVAAFVAVSVFMAKHFPEHAPRPK